MCQYRSVRSSSSGFAGPETLFGKAEAITELMVVARSTSGATFPERTTHDAIEKSTK